MVLSTDLDCSHESGRLNLQVLAEQPKTEKNKWFTEQIGMVPLSDQQVLLVLGKKMYVLSNDPESIPWEIVMDDPDFRITDAFKTTAGILVVLTTDNRCFLVHQADGVH
jgi:hypothetical protein